MTIFKLPDLGEGLPDAEIREWYIKEGDHVKLDQPLVSMETAKAVVDVPSPFEGIIAKRHGNAGDVIETGASLIEFESDNPTQTEPSSADTGTVVGVIESSDTVLEESPTGVETQTKSINQIRATPAIRALAKKLNVDLTKLQGTGARGTITADDVTKALPAANTTDPTSFGEPLHGARRIMAQQMARSHMEVVPVTLSEDIDVHHWDEKTDITVTLLQAIAAAAKAEPMLNTHFHGNSISLQQFDEVNIGIAVDTKSGLYVPVLKNADTKSSAEIRETLNAFKQKAQSQSFSPDDLKDATITLSNFGTITGKYANPIIIPPTVAIIGIGKTRPMVVADNNTAVVHNVMPVSLTFDHRAATGGEAARFLAAFIEAITHR